MRVTGRRCQAMLLGGLVASGCAVKGGPVVRQQCVNPDARLGELVRSLETERAAGCRQTPSRCNTIPLEIERQALVCSTHVPTMMAAAVLAYEQRQPVRAEQWLDTLLSMEPGDADAADLRARIAIEEGNLPFALKLLEREIELAPSHMGLRETIGAAFFLSGRLPEAQLALARAERLGSPHWRVAYNLGLVAEARGDQAEARRLYRDALQGRPAWPEAEARLRALELEAPDR